MRDGEVAIVGSGIAGVTIANILLDRGAASRVTIYESGPLFTVGDRRKWWDFVTTNRRPYQSMVDEDVEIAGNPDQFRVQGGRLMVAGGSTVHWGGWCPRYKEEDFQLNTLTNKGFDWPFSYDDLEPYYVKAEGHIGVAGDASRDTPPRYGKEYPVKAVPLTQKDGPVVKAFDALNIGNYGNLPIARNNNCITTGTCKYCPNSGRYDATMGFRTNSKQFVLKANSPVKEIIMRSKHEASGLVYLEGPNGKEKREYFDQIIVCAGTIESSRLLLASRNSYWADGLGNDSGHVGRHLVSHPYLTVAAAMPSNPKVFEQELEFPTLECRHYDTAGAEQNDGKFYFVRDGRPNRFDFASELMSGKSIAQLNQELVGEVIFRLTGFVEEFESPGNRITITDKNTDRFGLPNAKIAYTPNLTTLRSRHKNIKRLGKILETMGATIEGKVKNHNPRADHAVATCRMSSSPSDGVVDPNLRIHDCSNVFVVSNAVIPNVAAVNPTLTLTALAIRFAETV